MNFFIRTLVGFGLIAAGYAIGREIGKHESIRKELEEKRKHQQQDDDTDSQSDHDPS